MPSGNKPLFEPMMALYIDAYIYMQYSVSLS